MSTVKTNNILDASGGNTATINSMTPTADSLQGFRNRIINGDMRIDQRNAGAAVTTEGYVVDRFRTATTGLDQLTFSAQQDTSAPTGFVNSSKITITAAETSWTDTEAFSYDQRIEGTNIADLAWGSASAKTVTLSFWVRSSLTGTFGGALRNSGATRSYVFSYTISAADTWEYKTVTVAGDTSGTWLTTTGIGIILSWSLGAGADRQTTAGSWNGANYSSATGQVQVGSTLNATWYITGVQLEVGSTATPFERRPYGTELQLCQRYYYRVTSGGSFTPLTTGGFCTSTTAMLGTTPFPVEMRVKPTALEQSGTAGNYNIQRGGSGYTCSAVPAFSVASTYSATTNFTTSSGLTEAHGGFGRSDNNSTAYLGWSAEL